MRYPNMLDMSKLGILHHYSLKSLSFLYYPWTEKELVGRSLANVN